MMKKNNFKNVNLRVLRKFEFSDKKNINFEIKDTFFDMQESIFLRFSSGCIRAFYELLELKKIRTNISEGVILINRNIDQHQFKIAYTNGEIAINWNENTIVFQDFKRIVHDLYDVLNEIYSVNNLDLRSLDPVYLEHMLCIDLPFLYDVSIEEHHILDLFCYDFLNNHFFSVLENEFYRKLTGSVDELTNKKKTNLLLDSDNLRLERVCKSITLYGYPYKEKYLITYNNDNIVRDGTRRLACLFFEYGNIKIKVLNLKFTQNYYSVSMYDKRIINNGKASNFL